MKLLKHYYSIFLILIPAFVYSQQYPFENFTTEKGLPANQILSLFQNNDGVLWIGTSNGGFALYDGSSFEYLTDKNGLPDNIIFDINKNKKGQILIATNNGLSVYDGINFKNYTTLNGLGHNRIMKIFIDHDQNTWLGTAKGAYLMNDTLFSLFDKDTILNKSSILNIYQDSQNVFWFCTTNGLFKYNGKSIINYNNQNGLEHNMVYGIIENAKGKYYVLNHKGVYELSTSGITRKSLGSKGFKDLPCYSALIDSKGNCWISSREGVLKITKTTTQLINEKNGLVNNDIWKIFQDRENNLWFASKTNGLSKLSSERFYYYTTENGLTANTITSIFKTKNDKCWFGTENGLALMQGDSFIMYHSNKDGLSDDNLISIAEDKNGMLWIGGGIGLNKYDGKMFTQYYASENKNLDQCHKIYFDRNGTMWLGTKGGLANLIQDKIVSASGNEINFDVFDIYQDKQGIYWLATENGLYNYDGIHYKHFTEKEGITEKRIRTIVQDTSGIFWMSSSSGIYSFANGKFNNYTTENGLLSNTVYSLVIDKQGRLWAGMTSGIDRIDIKNPAKIQIKHYEQADGFVGQYCSLNSILADDDGKVWIGTPQGLVIYQPKEERENLLEPLTKIKGIYLYAQPTQWKDFTDSVGNNNIPLHLSLPYEKNYLSFHFVGTSLTAPSKVRYQYMLKGLDKDWLPITNKTEAIYPSIPFGEYEFLVKAENEEGIWNQNPVSFSFEIEPPFWRTWWFYSICIIIVLSGIFSYIQIRNANIKISAANKEILEQKNIIEEKNIDLENANVEIAKKNKDITDSINYAKRIQEAILPPEKLVKEYIQNSFILFKPKDIVSGDFYWMGHKDNHVLFAVGDCTGHGVPGALMSMVGHNGLNAALKEHELIIPGEILDQLNTEVEETFSQQEHNAIKDGMDMALCCIDYNKNILHFSGANNPIYMVRKQDSVIKNIKLESIEPSSTANQFSIYEIKGDRQPIGAFDDRQKFVTHSLLLEKNDSIYIFSDGYADQFGGPKGKKFMYTQLKKVLLSIQNQNMQEQKTTLLKAFEDWRGEHEQVDDVCVIGIKI